MSGDDEDALISASSVAAAQPAERRPKPAGKARSRARAKSITPAETAPIARVLVDIELPHLDRTFDYRVPATLDEAAVPGCRVQVRFAGQDRDGFLLERADTTEHSGALAYLKRVVTTEPVLTPEIAALAREVADRYAGTMADVLRLAVPPRHARVEREPTKEPPTPAPAAEPGPAPGSAVESRSASESAAEPSAPESAAEAGPAPEPAVEPGSASESAAEPAPAAKPGVVPESAAVESRSASEVAAGARSALEPGVEAGPAPGTVAGAMSAPGTAGRAGAALGRAAEAGSAPGTAAEAGAVPERAAEAGGAPGRAVEAGRASGAGLETPEAGPWERYVNGASYLGALAAGRAPRAVWSALPGGGWPAEIAVAVRATLAAGRGAVVVAADARDVARIDAALAAELGEGRHVALSAELGPAERYRRFLAVLRGRVRAVVGTRAAAFAPVADLGLVALWDDGDDVHADQHAPYPHVREVLALRAHRAGAAALIGGFAGTAEAAQLVAAGWAHRLRADRVTVREHAPRIRPAGEDSELVRDQAARSARLPSLALRVAREALKDGPVLVQVPRRGYLPAIACGGCRAPARCAECQGPLALRSAHAVPYCRWCGRLAGDRRCPECGDRRIRAVVTGARRTAEELGRAFAPVPVRTSGRDGVLATVGEEPALVVATPGAEPVATGSYAAALLLDGWALLGRADLRAAEEALRRWMNAAALVRPASAGGEVVVLSDASLPAVQALVRWDPVTHAERELAERAELGFPPAVRMAAVDGPPAAVALLLAGLSLPEGAEVLGPVPLEGAAEERERALIRVPRASGAALARALHDAAGIRTARKEQDPVRIQIDPLELI